MCPPYDVISADEQAAFYEKHPYNAIRLELTRGEQADRSDLDRYRRAATDFAAWRSEAVLIRESTPALYAYAHEFTLEGTRRQRRGLLAALRVEPWAKRIVRPHERTLLGPKRDRLELMRACRANVSPIWGLYADAPDATRELWESISAREPDAEATDGDAVVHRAWVVTDPALLRSLHGRLAGSPVYIADGHHRYETAMHYEEERCNAEPCAADAAVHFTLAYLVDVADPGLIVLGTHRLINSPRPLEPDEVIDTLERSFDLEPRVGGAKALLEAVQTDGIRPAFGVWAPALGLSTVVRLRADAVPEAEAAGKSLAWRKLDLAALHTLVVDRLYAEGTSELSESGRLRYVRSINEVERAMGAGEIDLALLVRDTSVQQVTAVADAGDLMPEKSTYFYPKPVTGLAIASLDDAIPPGV